MFLAQKLSLHWTTRQVFLSWTFWEGFFASFPLKLWGFMNATQYLNIKPNMKPLFDPG